MASKERRVSGHYSIWREIGPLLVCAVVGIGASAFAGREFLSHAQLLAKHVRRDNPAIVSTDAQLNQHLDRYLFDEAFAVHFVIGGGVPYSVSADESRQTLQRLGRYAQSEAVRWDPAGRDIADTYLAYLEDRLYLLGRDSMGSAREGWDRLFDQANQQLGRYYFEDRSKAMRAAEALLRRSASTSTLANARAIMSTYVGPPPNAFELPFEVLSLPPPSEYPYLGQRAVVSLRTGAERVFEPFRLSTLDRQTDLGLVKASVVPIFSNVRFHRRWMRENLMDEPGRLSPDIRMRYFGRAGGLRLVPHEMVLEVGRDLLVAWSDGVDSIALHRAIEGSACCLLQNDREVLQIHPPSILELTPGQFTGRTPPATPVVRAVISKRRTNQ